VRKVSSSGLRGVYRVIEEGLPELEEKFQAAKAKALKFDDLEREARSAADGCIEKR